MTLQKTGAFLSLRDVCSVSGDAVHSWPPGGDVTRGAEGLKAAEAEPPNDQCEWSQRALPTLDRRPASTRLSTLAFP